jgi:ComF family protein
MKTLIPLWTASLREALFPGGCALCGKALYPGAEALYGLCVSCGERLKTAWPVSARCSRCGQPLISERGTCLSCRNAPERAFDRIFPLFPYSGKYRKCLKAYKFGGRHTLGNFFADLLLWGLEQSFFLGALPEHRVPHDTAYDTAQDTACDTAWVPVPPRPGKIKHGGWDQIDHLAGLLEKKYRQLEKTGDFLTLPVCRCLQRLPSETQKELDREKRRINLKGRIILAAKKGNPDIPRRAVLFDDVYTTGSTMDACAETLKQGGAEQVYGMCLCYD